MKSILAKLVIALIFAYLSLIKTVEAKSITFAYQTPTLSSILPIVVAQDLGIFASEGLEVKAVFVRGGPTAIAALISGDVDYTLVAGIPAVRAVAQGEPLVIVAGYQPYIDYTLIAAKGISALTTSERKLWA